MTAPCSRLSWRIAALSGSLCLLACARTGIDPLTARDAATPPILPVLAREMHAISDAMHTAGLRAQGPALAGFMLTGNHATLPIRIPAGQCVTIASRATRGARDVDAALYAAEGRLLALDSEPDAHPTLQACGGQVETQAYYVIQFYDGDGSFVAVPFVGPRASTRRAAAAFGGRPAFAEITVAPEVAEDPVVAFTEGLRKRGYAAVGEPRRFEITEGERVRENLQVESGKCYTVAAFGGNGIAGLGVRVLDERGDELSASDRDQPQASTQLCARASGVYALESAALAGAGEVLVLVYTVDVMTAGGEAGLWLGHRPVVAAEPGPLH
jgi:hypothetical protein